MNAVKRCLALIAATLVVGACGGDPTAENAGTDLSIRATPGAVWVRNNASATVNIEAIDALGGPVAGTWAVGTIVGPMTAALDPTYQNTSTGALGVKSRFVITPTAEGEGSVQFTGTGGSIVVPVRVAPDTGAFNITVSDSSPSLFQIITATAPAGIVFTPATTVRFFSGPLSRDTSNGGLSFPAVLSLSADSSQITFVQGPAAFGTPRFTAVASRSTPGLVSTARAGFAMAAVPTVDTNAIATTPQFRSTGNRTTATVFDTLVLTAPAGYVFVPATTLEFFRIVSGAYTVANGTATPKRVSISADSSTMRYLVAPGARGRLRFTNLAARVAPKAQPDGIRHAGRGASTETFDLRSGVSGPDTANFAITFSKVSPIAEGDTVTATAPAGMVFLPGTVSIHATSSGTMSGGDSARITLRSADSTRVTFVLPPGASGKFRYSRMALRADPEIVWQGRSAGTISAVAAPAVVASLTPGTANMNDTITISLDPAGPYRFRPTSNAIAGGVASILNRVSTDSLTLKVLATPGTSGPLTLTNIRYGALPSFQVQAATASSVTINAATSLGPDDPTDPSNPVITMLTTAGSVRAWYDASTMTEADPTVDGGAAAQFYTVTTSVTGSYTFTVNWGNGGDVDATIAVKDGSYGALTDLITTAGMTFPTKPEAFTATLTAGVTYTLIIIDWDGDNTDWVSVRAVRN